MSTLDAQSFEGKKRENSEIQLSRDLFLDSLTIAITAITIGFPALSWVYSYVPLTRINPTIRCFPPDNVSLTVSIADLEYFCQYNQTLHAAFFPIVIAFLAFWIAVPHYIWRNYHTGKFDLFTFLVTKLKSKYNISYTPNTESKNENHIIAQRLIDIFSENNNMFISYIIVKVFQATVALFTCLFTVILYHTYFSSLRSIFNFTSNVPTFDCDVDKFDSILNVSSTNIQVPCIENFSRSTAFILFVDFITLLIVFLVSIGSIVWHFLVHPKELEPDQAAKFSYRTGMPIYCYKSKFDLKKYGCTCTGSDLDFLIVLLCRTDRSIAELLWEVRTHSKIKLLTNNDFMWSDRVYIQQKSHPMYDAYGDLEEALHKLDEDLKDIKLQDPLNSKASSLRGHVLIISLNHVLDLHTKTAVYIAPLHYSFGMSLALSRAFKKVIVLRFDPFFEKDGDNFYQIKEWSGNTCLLTLPVGILASDATRLTNVGEAIDKAKIKDVSLIVTGPLQNTTSKMLELMTIFDLINAKLDKACKMLVITPESLMSHGATRFHSFTPHTDTWEKEEIIMNPESDTMKCSNCCKVKVAVESCKIKTPDGCFMPKLYKRLQDNVNN